MSRRSPSPASLTTSSSPALPTPPSLSASSTAPITSRDPVTDFDVAWSDRLGRHDEIEMETFDGPSDEDDEDDAEDEEEKGFLGGRGGGGAGGVGLAGASVSGSGGPAEDFELFTPDEERRVRRKLDRRLVLFMGLLYLLSFLDRSSVYTRSSSFPLLVHQGLILKIKILVTRASPVSSTI